MSSLVISGDTSGTITLAVPSVSGTNTATLPAATGTVMVSGNMPAFSAYQSVSQNITSATFTKIQFQTKEFDTNSNFDNTTNYRFTPTVAGYYQVNAVITLGVTSTALCIITIYKNGSRFKDGAGIGSTGYGEINNASALIYLNGSTDYIEIYGYQNAGTTSTTTTGANTIYFQACLLRSA